MKKLITLFALVLAFNSNSIQAQSIVTPIGDEVNIVNLDPSARDLELINRTTGDVVVLNSVAELNAMISLVSTQTSVSQSGSTQVGNYTLRYTINGNRHTVNFKINN